MIRAAARVALIALWIACVAGLVALGTWQVHRRAWKLDLIARVDAGMNAAPVAAPVVAGAGDAYRRVRVSGRFLRGADSFVQASTVRGPGWWVVTPLVVEGSLLERFPDVRAFPKRPFPGEGRGPVAQQKETGVARRNQNLRNWAPASAGEGARREGVNREGVKREGANSARTILINRGYVAERRTPPPPSSSVTVTGLLRLTEPGGGFLRSNDAAADRWYSRDVAAIAAKRRIPNPAPYFIDEDATRNAPGQPVGGLTVVQFSNNHLVYAITWYVLAMMTAAGLYYWLTIRRRRG